MILSGLWYQDYHFFTNGWQKYHACNQRMHVCLGSITFGALQPYNLPVASAFGECGCSAAECMIMQLKSSSFSFQGLLPKSYRHTRQAIALPPFSNPFPWNVPSIIYFLKVAKHSKKRERRHSLGPIPLHSRLEPPTLR